VTQVRRLVLAAAVVAAVAMVAPGLMARQTAPGAPSNLTYISRPGGGVDLQWTHSTGTFTHYVIEAGGAPGAPFLRLPTSSFNDNNLYGKLPHLLASFSANGVATGDYYVRIRGANGAAESDPSNEILLPLRAGCVAPGAPTNFTQIVRGNQGFLMWNAGSGGQPNAYIVQASFSPNDPNPPIQLPLGSLYFTLGIPSGSYFVKVVAVNACGTSAASNELNVVAPFNTPARTPDPAPGQRLPQPYVRDQVFQFGNEARALGYMSPQTACPPRAGNFTDPIEARKTQLNPFINYVVDKLRQIDTRFGYNAKPSRAWVPAIIAGDEIAYHYGSDPPLGSPNTFAVDVLAGHCTGISGDADRHGVDYRVFYNEFVTWTGAGRF
jgi:hypothetical protein